MNRPIIVGLLTILPWLSGAAASSRTEAIPVSEVLRPNSSYYGKNVIVFGYFKKSGVEADLILGRICLDRESMENFYVPYCLLVEIPSALSRSTYSADGKFALVEGTAEVEGMRSAFPGRLVKVIRVVDFSSSN